MENILSFNTLFESYLNGVTDHEVLATTLIGEAGAEGDKGMTAVLNVIRNRSIKKNTTKAGEALRPYRFSMWNSATKNVSNKSDYTIADIKKIVDEAKKHPKWNTAIKLIKSDPADITKGSNAYYAFQGPNKIQAPNFTKSWVFKTNIGNHKFGYIEKL